MKKWMLVLLAVLVVMLPAWAMAATVDLSSIKASREITLSDGDIITGTLNLPNGEAVRIVLPASRSANITLQDVTLENNSDLSITSGSGSDLTITLEGENTLEPAYISAGGNLTIQGNGSLTVTHNSYPGINVQNGNLTIQGYAKVTATSAAAEGIKAEDSELIIKDSAVVTATSTGSNGISVIRNNMTIQDSAVVTASSARGAGIRVSASVTIQGSVKVKATGGKNSRSQQAAGIGIECDGYLTIDIDDNGFVEAIGGDAVDYADNSQNGYGIRAGADIVIKGRVTAKAGQSQCEESCNGIESMRGTITIRPGSRVEATGYKHAGIYAKGQVSGASLLSMLPTGGDITVVFDKLSDVLIMTGATSRTAQERALPDDVTASSLSLANFAKEDVYVLIDTTGNPFPAVPAAPADTSGSLPKTGDSANLVLWAALLTVSALCAATLTRKIKKQH